LLGAPPSAGRCTSVRHRPDQFSTLEGTDARGDFQRHYRQFARTLRLGGQAIAATPDLAALIRNPEIGRDAAAKAMDAVAQVLGLSELTRKFLGVLAANRRLAKLPEVVRAFSAIAAAQRGEVTAEVTSAHALSDAQIAALTEKLKVRQGREVKLTAKVDPALLGGLVVRIGSEQIDGSIRTRLNSLATAMKG
jgi:F-type H+-transporting ATPase subunit delta